MNTYVERVLVVRYPVTWVNNCSSGLPVTSGEIYLLHEILVLEESYETHVL